MTTDSALQVEKLSFWYTARDTPALAEVSFSLPSGAFLGVTGPAGAGKSTLCDCLNGVIPHYRAGRRRGSVLLAGTPVEALPLSELGRHVGTVFEDPDYQMVSETVEEEVAFGPEHLGLPPEHIEAQVNWALEALEIARLRGRIISTLSGGEKQRVAIAAALAARPPLLVLDEPTSELDPLGTEEVFAALRQLNHEQGITVVLVSQKVDLLATHADRLLVLEGGQVVDDGSPQQIFARPERLDAVGVAVPPVARLAVRLRETLGLSPDGHLPLDVESGAALRDSLPFKPARDTDPEPASPGGANGRAVEVQNLTHRYPNGVLALREVSLLIDEGEFVAVIGHNGSGKTTFAKHLNGLLRATEGTVKVFGSPIGRRRVSELARSVGYAFQNPDHQIFNPTVREEVAFGPRNLGLGPADVEAAVQEALSAVHLLEPLDDDPADLSKGQRQRLAVASVLAMRPQLVVIDEPTTGQDWREGRAMMALARELNQAGRTVLFITHDMELVAEFAQRVLVFGEGRLLLDGTPRHVFGRPDVLRQSGLQPPQLARLAQALPAHFPATLLTEDEFLAALRSGAEAG